MEQKAMTVRLDPEQAAQLEAVAEANGAPVSEEIRRAITAYIEATRQDKEFQARLRASIERHREILDKLAH
jgi:predicted transcriptional regulator